MDLRGQEIKNTYGNVVTIGSSAGSPTTGELTNGQNYSFTASFVSGDFGVGITPNNYANLNTLTIGSAAASAGGIIDFTGTSGRLASIYTEASGKLVFTADPTNAQAGTSMEFNVDGSNAMFIDSSQNVGIGTVSPAQKLEVSGTVSAYRFISTSSTASLPSYAVSTGNGMYLAGVNTIGFSTFNTERMRIDSVGNVGIGTDSPSQKLHIDGSARITGAIYDSNNAAGTSGQVLSSTGTGTDWVSLSEISGVDGTGTANYISKWSDTDTITDSQIQDDGTTVGIGQAPSTAKLTVSGDIQTAAPETSTNAAWKLGNVGLGGVFVGAADYVTVSVGGLVVKLPIAIFPETQDYYDRVIADGGTFEGLLGYESAVTILKSN